MQHKDTSQQAFLIIYLIWCVFYNLFTFHLVDLGEFSPWLRLMSDSEVISRSVARKETLGVHQKNWVCHIFCQINAKKKHAYWVLIC